MALTAQLREALAANAEKTEECEKLKQQTDDLEKEVTVLNRHTKSSCPSSDFCSCIDSADVFQLRQSCVDEMIAQTNVLQVQLQLAAEANVQLKQQVFYHFL